MTPPARAADGEVSLHMDARRRRCGPGQRRDPDRRVLARDVRGAWTRGSTGPEVGASFKGHVKRNGVGPTYWSPAGHRVRAERGLRVRGRHRRRDAQQLGLPARARRRGTRSPSTSGSSRRCRCGLLDRARPAARPHQRARDAHHAGADEGGVERDATQPRGDAREARRPRRRAREGGGRRRGEVRRPPPRPRQAAAARADRAARRRGLGVPRAVAAGRLGLGLHRRRHRWSPASAWSRASSA